MLSARPRRLLTASIVLASGLTLAGCGTGLSAQTNAIYQPAVGANTHTGDVQLYNTVLVANPDGTYTLSAGLLNTTDTDQTLTGFSVAPLGESAGTPKPASTELPVVLKPNRLFTIGTLGQVIIEDSQLKPGDYADLTLSFATSGDVSIEAPIVARGNEGVYDSVAEGPESGDGIAAE